MPSIMNLGESGIKAVQSVCTITACKFYLVSFNYQPSEPTQRALDHHITYSTAIHPTAFAVCIDNLSFVNCQYIQSFDCNTTPLIPCISTFLTLIFLTYIRCLPVDIIRMSTGWGSIDVHVYFSWISPWEIMLSI